jgi:hypothetical protein
MYIEYPKWLYHPDGRRLVVKNRDEEEALGDEWADTPAAFPSERKPKKTKGNGNKA